MKLAALTSPDGYFEHFEPGMLIRHARGKTVTEMDNVMLTNMVMNTAEGHFNEDAMRRAGGIFTQRVVFGGINLSMVLGLAAQAAGTAGKPKEAAQFHQRALGIDPMSEQDWRGLSRALETLGDPRARLAAQREAWWAVDLD